MVNCLSSSRYTVKIRQKTITFRMKNTNKKLIGQSRVVKYSFTGNNITKYSGLNTVAKYMNKQGIVKSISTLFTTEWHSATKFGVNQVLISIVMSSFCGINRICKIASFTGDGLVRALLKLVTWKWAKVFFRVDIGFFSGELFILLESFGWDYIVKVKLPTIG